MAASDATRQAVWLRQLLDDLGLGLGQEPLKLLNDNAGTIALAKNPALPSDTFDRLRELLGLWIRDSLSRRKVQAGVQAEWGWMKTEGESATGMFAKSNFRSKSTFNNPNKQFDRFPPADHSKYCSIHQRTSPSTENFFKNRGKISKSANVALKEPKATEESKTTADIAYLSDASAFLTAVATADDPS
ncbi:hypothetical protein M231_06705 [Tremella mesenterica]|uniref:Reverse transcriptase Ty1/copia-type domain-containing protein n=1 Tax=Tremella mesenterica TaxID=5217 RepID=A0A4Q1BD42_TREME|nr:hypothetical protein M231_06705 [Tremella mesenterica]